MRTHSLNYGFLSLVIATSLCASISNAEDGASGSVQTSAESNSASPAHSFGVRLGLGDPFPGLVGVGASYNFTKDIRAKVGYAEVEASTGYVFTEQGLVANTIKAQTFAAGAEYLFTDWSFRPVAGLQVGYFDVSGKGKFEIEGFKESTAYIYSNLGIDWISDSGYHFATGLNVALVEASGTGMYASGGYMF